LHSKQVWIKSQIFASDCLYYIYIFNAEGRRSAGWIELDLEDGAAGSCVSYPKRRDGRVASLYAATTSAEIAEFILEIDQLAVLPVDIAKM
jgi:hypothetical protein